MDDGIDAIALLESERTILERAVRTAWREWAPEDLRTSLGPTPSLASILEKLDELREAESNPTTSSSTQRLDGPSPRRRPSAATLLANFVSEELADTPASAALTEVTRQDLRTLQIFLYRTDAGEAEVAQRRQQIDRIWDESVLGLYYTTRRVSEVSIGSVLTASGEGPRGPLSMMGSGDVEDTFRHLKLCMAAGGFEFRGLVGEGQLGPGCLFTPEGRGSGTSYSRMQTGVVG